MHENEIARLIVHASYKIHTTLGPGLLESVYEAVLFYELEKLWLVAARQVPIPVVIQKLSLMKAFVQT
jgi:GxxExxY protein